MDPKRDDPRISVDTLQDWHRLKANFTNSALARLDEQLAASGSTSRREALVHHLNQFIDRAFEISKPNVRVNGRNLEDVDDEEYEFEPFDEGLDRHIWLLSEQNLKWDGEISRKRRVRPQEVEAMMVDLLERQRALDEETALDDLPDDPQTDTDELPDELYSNAEDVASQTYAITEELRQAVPIQTERAERLKSVSEEIKALKL